ncbi:MAG: transglutaminase domain-containing protein [Magnetococcales bacterium]|nr:transglutaminase domain-containing protein [Magnetococcales bacterium]
MNGPSLVKMPPVLLGAGILFWGWQTGFLVLGMVLAVVIESRPFVPWQWSATDRDFYRVADFSTGLLVMVLGWAFFVQGSDAPVIGVLRMLPLVFFLLMTALLFSDRKTIPLSSLFFSLRKKKPAVGETAKGIAPAYPYFGICLVAAGAVEARNPWYFVGIVVLVAWSLWPVRGRWIPAWVWGMFLSLAVGMGYVGQAGLNQLQEVMAEQYSEWLIEMFAGEKDSFKRRTAIGDVGRLKGSGRILFRVQANPLDVEPLLLREGSFNLFMGSEWHASRPGFRAMTPLNQSGTWQLGEKGAGKPIRIHVWKDFSRGRGVLPIPLGTYQLQELLVQRMQFNRFASVKVDEGPPFPGYGLLYQKKQSQSDAPDDRDLQVPVEELPVLQEIVQELGLTADDPEGSLGRLEAFFVNQFSYSLYLESPGKEATPVGDFLRHTRSGHCEYFATASVLLLRAAGIPARYASGWSVQEYWEEEGVYVVRGRHAHAWATAFVNGHWQDVDNTPGAWIDFEEARAQLWQGLMDLWSKARFHFSQWQGARGLREIPGFYWLVLIPGYILGKRLWKKGGAVRAGLGRRRPRTALSSSTPRQTPLDPLLTHLAGLGQERQAGESLGDWIRRLKRPELIPVITLYYRYRFDPEVDRSLCRKELEAVLSNWLSGVGREKNSGGGHGQERAG